jgi:hypothetical protein
MSNPTSAIGRMSFVTSSSEQRSPQYSVVTSEERQRESPGKLPVIGFRQRNLTIR